MRTYAYAAHAQGAALAPYTFNRRDVRNDDVAIDILYCGVCHSDLHVARNDWGGSKYPVVPGHEIVGRVRSVGKKVKRFKEGDLVAVGCMVDSCLSCDQCHNGLEQYCREGFTGTYNSVDRSTGEPNHGGYSTHIVVREAFVVAVPESLELQYVAPLLCAGITTYSPLKAWGVTKGTRVGVIGLGGLGHMAVKLAKALGAEVTVLGRTESKAHDALSLGANTFLVSTDRDAMAQAQNGFDVMIDTIPVEHDVSPYLPLLDVDGSLVLVGQIGNMQNFTTVPMIMGRRRIAGSVIGGIKETQEMLNFCAEHNVLPECEMITIDQINEAYERMERSDVRYRFVIDMSSLAK